MSNFFKRRKDLHLQRKIFHFITILIIAILMVVCTRKEAWLLYGLVGFPFFIMDVLRTKSHRWNKFALKVVGPIIRKHEVQKVSGSSWAFIGIGLTFFIFPPLIAQLSTLFLAVGDPVASFFGVLFGRTKILNQKSWVGTLAAFIACTLSAALFFYILEPFSLSPSRWALIILLSGLIGALTELVPIGRLDDNLTQPLMNGILLSLLIGGL